MKQRIEQSEPVVAAALLPPLQPIAKKQLILRYHQTRARGTQDVTHSQGTAFLLGVEAYCMTQGYRRLESHLACMEVWDRGYDTTTKKQKNDRFIVVIHVGGCELVYILENIELFEHFCHDVVLTIPILPELLYSQHGIKC